MIMVITAVAVMIVIKLVVIFAKRILLNHGTGKSAAL
jgi:hypothetical protein